MNDNKHPARIDRIPILCFFKPWFGLILGVLTCFSFVMMDLAAQYLQVIDPIDSISVMFLRMVVSLVGCYGWLWVTKCPDLPFGPRKHWPILALRSCMTFCGLLGFFFAVRHIHMSDAITIYQSRPFILAFFSKYYLNEPLNLHQAIASACALLGEILIAKPSQLFSPPSQEDVIPSGPGSISHSSNLDHYISYGIIWATVFCTVFELVVVRKLEEDVGPAMFLALFSLASVILSSGSIMLPSSVQAWAMMGLVAVFGILTQVMFALTLKMETAITLAIIGQLGVIFAAAGEYAIFGTHFDSLSSIGAVIVTSAGVWAICKRPDPVPVTPGPKTAHSDDSNQPLLGQETPLELSPRRQSDGDIA